MSKTCAGEVKIKTSVYQIFVCFFVFVVRIEPRALLMLGKTSTIEPNPNPIIIITITKCVCVYEYASGVFTMYGRVEARG